MQYSAHLITARQAVRCLARVIHLACLHRYEELDQLRAPRPCRVHKCRPSVRISSPSLHTHQLRKPILEVVVRGKHQGRDPITILQACLLGEASIKQLIIPVNDGRVKPAAPLPGCEDRIHRRGQLRPHRTNEGELHHRRGQRVLHEPASPGRSAML